MFTQRFITTNMFWQNSQNAVVRNERTETHDKRSALGEGSGDA